jgi:hypothetical protein
MVYEETKQRLLAAGIQAEEVDLAIRDVQKMIAAKIFIRFVPDITPELQQRFAGQTEDQVTAYLKQHPEEFPAISPAAVEKIEQETWASYFAAMEKV